MFLKENYGKAELSVAIAPVFSVSKLFMETMKHVLFDITTKSNKPTPMFL